MAEALGQLGKPERGERLPLQIVTRRLVKTVTENPSVCITVICILRSRFVC
jgi:hypothetical protein